MEEKENYSKKRKKSYEKKDFTPNKVKKDSRKNFIEILENPELFTYDTLRDQIHFVYENLSNIYHLKARMIEFFNINSGSLNNYLSKKKLMKLKMMEDPIF